MKDKEENYSELIVTHTQVFLAKIEGKLKATAKIILNSQLQLTGLKLIEGINGLFVGYPSELSSSCDNEYHDVYYPLAPKLRNQIDEKIIEEYHYLLEVREKNER